LPFNSATSYRIRDVLAIPRKQVLHAMDRSEGHVKSVSGRVFSEAGDPEQHRRKKLCFFGD
jgi:hypothetical protein